MNGGSKRRFHRSPTLGVADCRSGRGVWGTTYWLDAVPRRHPYSGGVRCHSRYHASCSLVASSFPSRRQ